jgi:hypothetical protein
MKYRQDYAEFLNSGNRDKTSIQTGTYGAMPPLNYERRLTYRFLTLPFRHQIAIANSLNLLTDEDQALSDEPLFRELFKRATAAGLVTRLWDETEKRHTDTAPFNPFETA